MTKVLIFESDHAFAVELRTELSMLGCTVQVFKEGATGLAAAQQTRPDLALISADLRPMNGFSICNKLKKDPILRGVPVMLMSADQGAEIFEQHGKLPSRADAYVRKPIPMSELLARIRALVPLLSLAPKRAASLLSVTAVLVDDVSALAATVPPSLAGAASESEARSRKSSPLDVTNENVVARSAVELGSRSAEGFLHYELGDADEDEATAMGPSPRLSMLAPAPALALPTTSEPTPEVDEQSMVFDEPSKLGDEGPSSRSREGDGDPGEPGSGDEEDDDVPQSTGLWLSPASSEDAALALAPTVEEISAPAPSVVPAPPLDPANQTAAIQLRQALVQAHQELQRVRPQLTELSRVRTELTEARRELADVRDAAQASAAKELVGLREELEKRERALLELREETTARQRELLDSRVQHTALSRELGEVRERSFALERRAAETIARLDGVSAEKSLAERTVDDLKDKLNDLSEELQQRTLELRDQGDGYEKERSRFQLEHAEAARQTELRLRKELASMDEQHAQELLEVRARYGETQSSTEALRRELEARHASELGEAERASNERARATKDETRGALTLLQERHATALAEGVAEHAAALDKLRQEHADGLVRAATPRAEQLERLQEQVRTARLDASTQTHRAEELADRLETAEASRQQLLVRTAELELDVRRARDEVDDALRKGDAFETARAAWSLADTNLRRQNDALQARIASVDEDHAALFAVATAAQVAEFTALQAERDKLAAAIETQAERHSELEREQTQAVATRRSEVEAHEANLSKLRGELQTAQAGLQRARERWSEDRVALQKARDAITSLIAASETPDSP